MLPHPLLSVVLVGLWLLLVNSISVGHILLGAVLGVAIPVFTDRFWPERPHIARPGLLVRFFLGTFLYDVLVANIRVVMLILQRDIDRLRPAFIEIPLDTDDHLVISMLASVISLTPGTVSCELSSDCRTLIVHCLHSLDPEDDIRTIKSRYEAPLKEIFSC